MDPFRRPARALGIVAAVALVLLAAPAPAARHDAQRGATLPVPAPRFAGLPRGWRQLGDGGLLTRRGANASAVATSWAYHPSSLGWAAAIPRGGIAVEVLLIRREPGAATGLDLCRVTPHLASYPLVRRLPLRLPATTSATLEGSPDVPEYRIFGRIGESYDFEVRVDVRSRRPAAALLAVAQRAVAAIRFPRWPNRERC
jgi:hypothetical protein